MRQTRRGRSTLEAEITHQRASLWQHHFPRIAGFYFLADYRKRDRPAAAVNGGHRVAFAVVVIVVMVLLAKLIA